MEKLIEKNIQVPLILTDPPYGTIKNLKTEKNISWDTIIDLEDMFRLIQELLTDNGICLLFSQEPFTSQLILHPCERLEYKYKYIWVKNHFANPYTTQRAPANYFEEILCFKRGGLANNALYAYARKLLRSIGKTVTAINEDLGYSGVSHFFTKGYQFELCSEKVYNELIRLYGIDKYSFYKSYEELQNMLRNKGKAVFNLYGRNSKPNVLYYKKPVNSVHPTQKPVDLLKNLILTYTNKDDIVLDFTMGSGSTGVACKRTGRSFIGIELDANYFDIAKKRMEMN